VATAARPSGAFKTYLRTLAPRPLWVTSALQTDTATPVGLVRKLPETTEPVESAVSYSASRRNQGPLAPSGGFRLISPRVPIRRAIWKPSPWAAPSVSRDHPAGETVCLRQVQPAATLECRAFSQAHPSKPFRQGPVSAEGFGETVSSALALIASTVV
jgi:hypothetical protein